MRCIWLSAASVLLLSTPSFADAFTYVGTLGSGQIVIEMTEPADGPMLARYAKKAIGIDTPLSALAVETNRIILDEPASKTTVWTIEGSVGDNELTGSWQVPDLGYSLDLSLILIGSRPYERDDLEPMQSFARLPVRVDLHETPFEFMKMQDHYDGEPWSTSGGQYYMVSDPRTQFRFPRVLELRNGTSAVAINDFLVREHWRVGLEALDCLADTGSFGGYDEQVVTVHQLSSRIMSLTRAGAITCGGLSITAFDEHLNLDVVEGTPLELSKIFAGWAGGPGPELAQFVRERVDADDWQDGECDPGEELPKHIAVTFAEPAVVQFHLSGMSPPCNDMVLTRLITDLKPFLAEGALDYFEE